MQEFEVSRWFRASVKPTYAGVHFNALCSSISCIKGITIKDLVCLFVSVCVCVCVCVRGGGGG